MVPYSVRQGTAGLSGLLQRARYAEAMEGDTLLAYTASQMQMMNGDFLRSHFRDAIGKW